MKITFAFFVVCAFALPYPWNVPCAFVLTLVFLVLGYGIWVVMRASHVLHMDLISFLSLDTDEERRAMVARHYREQIQLWMHRAGQRASKPHSTITHDDLEVNIVTLDPVSQSEHEELESVRKHLSLLGYL